MSDTLNEVAFTGSHSVRLTRERMSAIGDLLAPRWQFPLAHQPRINRNHFHHGSCVNGDDQAGWVAHKMGYYIIVHPPLDDKLRAYSYYDSMEKEADYLQRDRDMVDQSRFLISAPDHYVTEMPKNRRGMGGTWYTTKYAFSVHRDGAFVWPDASIEEFAAFLRRVRT